MASFAWSDLKQAADDAGFSVIPAADYEVIVKSAEHKKTGTGKDKISVRFNVTVGPEAGKSVFNDFVISPDNGTALGFFFRHMKALGFGPDYFASAQPGEPGLVKLASDMVGRNCVVTVGIEQWNEEDRNRVKGIKASASAAAPLTAASAGPQPMASQPIAQPQPMAHPQPQPTAQPVSVAKKEEPKQEEPRDEAPASTVAEPEDVVPAAEPTDTAAKPKLPF